MVGENTQQREQRTGQQLVLYGNSDEHILIHNKLFQTFHCSYPNADDLNLSKLLINENKTLFYSS